MLAAGGSKAEVLKEVINLHSISRELKGVVQLLQSLDRFVNALRGWGLIQLPELEPPLRTAVVSRSSVPFKL